MNGVTDVRLQEIVTSPAINAPPSLRSGENQESVRPTVVAVLSVAAGTIVAAIALRRFMRRSGAADKFANSESDDDSFDATAGIATEYSNWKEQMPLSTAASLSSGKFQEGPFDEYEAM
jgi:hypothetical protein